MNLYAIERTGIPNASLLVLGRLGKTLVHDKPPQTNVVIEVATKKLVSCLGEVDTALTTRIRESNRTVVLNAVEFDRATDVQWIWVRRLLEGWAGAFGHKGLDGLSEPLQAKVDLPALRERAERARKLHDRLFGAEGTMWTRRAFIEQVESMAALLRLIKEDELLAELEEFVGPELPALLFACQEQYDAMVNERMSRTSAPADNFSELRAKLRWTIERYKNAIESLRDDEDPDSYALVDTALRSLILLNQRMNKPGGTELADELLGEGLLEIDAPIAVGPVDDEAEEAEGVEEAEEQG
ncbi:MAG: hypothetical protein R6X02_28460 [Enhygromyxa sp.]